MNISTTTLSNQPGSNEDQIGPHGISRRQLGVAVLAVLAGGLGMAKTVQARHA